MERAFFFSGQQVESEDLNQITETLGEQMKNRTIDFFTKGVVGHDTTYVVNDTYKTIKINPFVAYTNEGERIYMYKAIKALAMDLTNPEEKRLTHQGDLADDEFGWSVNTTYDIYVAYVEQPARPRAHTTSGEFFPTRIVSGFEFYAIRPGVDPVVNNQNETPLVRLCRLVFDGEMLHITTEGYIQYSSIDAKKINTDGIFTRPSTYDPTVSGVSTNLQDHIYCIGSGTPSPKNPHGLTPKDIGFEDASMGEHETQLHCSGLVVPDRQSFTSAFFIDVNSSNIEGTPDNLQIHDLEKDEFLQFEGKRLNNYAYTGYEAVFIQFTDGHWPTYTPLPEGTYRIGINPTTGKLAISCDKTAAVGRTARITSTSYGDAENDGTLIETVTIISVAEYSESSLFDLAEFYFTKTKQTSYIKTDFATSLSVSNFITKKDLRTFGTTDPASFKTTKETFTDVLTLPYNVVVDSLSLKNGAIISGEAMLPKSYIQGYTISYASATTIRVMPGICRDDTGARDIVLRSNITKSIIKSWAPGGSAGAVGGLQNQADSESSNFLSKPGGYGLHVFAIMNEAGDVDIALDTHINGSSLYLSTAATLPYKYKRRIGTVYISHHFGNPDPAEQEYMVPFTSVADGQGLWIIYTRQTPLEKFYVRNPDSPYYSEDVSNLLYKNNTWQYVYVPPNYQFMGKFGYQIPSGSVSIRRPLAPANLIIVGGYGEVDTHLSTNSLTTTTAFDFSANQICCVGYYDSRSIL